MTQPPDPTDQFAAHRGVLLGAAYRVLGSMSDAEDVVQESWLRWSGVDHSQILDARAYLVRITTRLALNHLRHRQRLREDYVGPWLPEPVSELPAPDHASEFAESVSIAMMVVLESLGPVERAAFVLREVFGEPYEEIAETLDRTPASVRQLVHRARQRVQERAPRHPVDPAAHREIAERFLAAMQGGSIPELLTLLAPSAVLTTDGGGKRRAALKPIRTAVKVLWFLAGIMRKMEATITLRLGTVNGEPAILGVGPDGVDSVGVVRIDGGRVTELYLIRNPDKLHHVIT